MRAIKLKGFGGVEQLINTEIPNPVYREGEVLVQVKAISVNPVDIKTRSGKSLADSLKQYEPLILGWDVSGIIVDKGNEVTNFKIGDEVFGMVNFPGHGKAYAEYVAVPATHLAIKPRNISHEEATAATLAALTAWQAIVHNAKVKQNDRVLIHAASGGVGHYAIQIAKYLGAYTIGTSSSVNREFVLNNGADEHIDYRAKPFEKVVGDMDLVLDTIGGDHVDRSLETVASGGTLITILSGLNDATMEKAKSRNVDCYFILVKSSGEDMQTLANLLEKSIIKSHVSKTYSFDQMANAHLQIESGRTVGKIVVTL